jgi:hypothetical protein
MEGERANDISMLASFCMQRLDILIRLPDHRFSAQVDSSGLVVCLGLSIVTLLRHQLQDMTTASVAFTFTIPPCTRSL